MKIHRINALVIRHLYLFKRSLPRLLDILFWPVVTLLTWGFLTVYLEAVSFNNVNIVSVLLGAIILWELLQRMQGAVAITFLEDVWERNFLNLFVTPLTIAEFLASTVILGIIRLVGVLLVVSVLSILLYHYSIFSLGFYFLPFLAVLMMFGFAMGLFNMAIILRFGTSAQILAFGLIFLVQPFSAVFYPVSALPESLQFIAYILPSTYVFEGMREVINTGTLPLVLLTKGLILGFLYMTAMIFFFYKMFAYVKREGRLLKLD